MTDMNVKRVHDPAEETDGYRVLVDRLWPRGLSKEKFRFELWAKEITPSTLLRQWFHRNKGANWPEFREK